MGGDVKPTMKTKKIMRGLSALFAFLMCVSIILGSIMEGYSTTIDSTLGTTSSVFTSESTDDDPLYDKYVPDDEYLNDDGTGNSEALIQAAIDLGREEGAEGSVLLKNDNDALPLDTGSNITLLGIRSVAELLGQGMGSYAKGPYISLAQALSENQTDFANTIATILGNSVVMNDDGTYTMVTSFSNTIDSWSGSEFEFDGAGMNVNPTMLEIYETLNETYEHANNEKAAEIYDPQEPTLAEYAEVNADYADSFATYGDAAIVILGRPSSESVDYLPGGVVEGTGASEPLELTDNERAVLELAKENFDTVIVLLNTTNVMEVAELQDDPDIDAILWIGFPGCYGMLGVADILCGKVSPSGGLSDTYATYNLSAPATVNMGYYTYSNADEVITDDDSSSYVVEAEGIYVGYKYYETRYYDSVLGVHNADSTAGTYASEGGWDYEAEMVYSFGYGLSYTTFSYEWDGEPELYVSIAEDGTPTATLTFNVKVTNTGDVAGKANVQIYGQAPYIEGGVEKSAIQLLEYGKTDTLEPNESEVVTVVAELQNLARYDSTYANADGTTGTYILDPGTYYFAVGNGAHYALNNIMALQGYTEEDGMVGEGDASMAYSLEITEDVISKTAFSISKAGVAISNQLEYADWNYFQEGEITYLSRSDWEATYPVEYSDLTLTDDQLISYLNGNYYTMSTTDDTSSILWDQDNGVAFYQMYGADYDDDLWTQLLDQMSLEEAMYIATYGGPSIPGASSIGLEEASMTENAATGIALALTACKDTSAPWAISSDDPNSAWMGCVFAGAPNIASSFNHDLQYDIGEFVGVESLFLGVPILWGPGLNTHRTAYNGRNGEYYSEDPILTGTTAMEFAVGGLSNGLIAAPKHFAFNDQETNRDGIAPYMTEQKAREGDLRAFQIAFEAFKYDTEDEDVGMLGVMTSFSKIGPVEVTCSYNLITNILEGEWGFKGYCVTDIYDDMDLYTAVLASGVTCYDTRGMSGFYGSVTLENTSYFAGQVDGNTVSSSLIDGDANLQESVKTSVHQNLYAFSQSNLMNRYNSTTTIEQVMVWWRVAYYAAIGVSAVLMVVCFIVYLTAGKKKEVK